MENLACVSGWYLHQERGWEKLYMAQISAQKLLRQSKEREEEIMA